MWESEDKDLPKDSTSHTTGVVGHLLFMIDPAHTQYGLATIDEVVLGVNGENSWFKAN